MTDTSPATAGPTPTRVRRYADAEARAALWRIPVTP